MSAPQFPWLKWFPRDFASATRTWPLVARAVYRELLDAQWDIGGCEPGILPDEPDQLRQLARATEAEWAGAWRFVARKFPRVKGGRQNPRLEEHRQAAVLEFEKKSNAGKLGNLKRWGNRSASAERSHRESHRDHTANHDANRDATILRSFCESPPAPAPDRTEEVRSLRRREFQGEEPLQPPPQSAKNSEGGG
jgi:uncharacterized protein YdaU (DUF1376 family)